MIRVNILCVTKKNIDCSLFKFALCISIGARPHDAYGQEGSSDAVNGGRLGRPGMRTRGRDLNITNFDTILQDILISVGGGEGAPMFFMGNPGDYAWGREGLDTIVTQLLNQMDNTGPPPLEKEKIEEIPTVQIEQDQVDIKLQCSVCWEDFQLNEPVRKLPCTHVFHTDCICPWLSNHGTCPICRKSLVNENTTEQQRTSLSAAAQAVANTISKYQHIFYFLNCSIYCLGINFFRLNYIFLIELFQCLNQADLYKCFSAVGAFSRSIPFSLNFSCLSVQKV